MKARSAATVGSDGSVTGLQCEPPLTLRRVPTDDGAVGLCLVGTAAGPLPGDDLALDLRVTESARLRVSATGASVAQGRGGRPARLRFTATLAADADLVADPGPLVVSEGACVDAAVTLRLAASASVCWREIVVLGRTTDTTPGAVTLRWEVTRGGHPVLRQDVDLADPVLRRWWGMTAGQRVLATAFVSGPGVVARTQVRGPTAVAQRIDDRSMLVTVLAAGAADASARLDELLAPYTTAPVAGPYARR